MAASTPTSPLSFITALSHRLMRASSSSSAISSGRAAPSRQDVLRRCSSDLTPSDVKEAKVAQIQRPRSARESEQGQQPNEQKTLFVDRSHPPQGQSNFHRRPTHSSVIEIFDNPLPQVDSSLPLLPSEAKGQHSPRSPDFEFPSVEVQRQRRLEKVRRMLGERVPPELIYRGGIKRIMNVNVFPDPPSPVQTDTFTRREQREKQPKKPLGLARRASLTPSSFPTLSSVSATLLPTGHALGKPHYLTI
jgi:hypothetical protein